MAKMNLKRSIAMLLVLNMLTGMIPVQALADEGETGATNVVITIAPSSEKSSSSEKKESAPAEKSESSSTEKKESAPAEKSESSSTEKKESAPAEKSESASTEKQESAPAEKTESASTEKQESAPAEKSESASTEKQESAPAEKTESASTEKQESAPAEKTESASTEKQESAPVEKTESASTEKQESAPAEKTESASTEKQESAPAEKTESASTEKQESAPAEKTEVAPVEVAAAEVASYQEESNAEPDSGSESTKEVVDVETSAGATEEVEVEVKTETTENEDGSTTEKKEAAVQEFVTVSGALVDFIGVSDMTTAENGMTLGHEREEYLVVKENADGSVYVAEGGYELTLENKEIEEEVTADVPLTDEEGQNQNTAFGGPEAGEVLDSTGNHPTSETDGKYDYTDTTVDQQGSVTITTTDITIENIVVDKVVDENGQVTEGTDLDYVFSETAASKENGMIIWVFRGNRTELPKEGEEIVAPEGYEYKYLGSGNTSMYLPVYLYASPDPENPEEDPIYVDADGNKFYVHGQGSADYSKAYIDGVETEVEGGYKATFGVAQQFVLVDAATGELITAYCADAETATVKDYGYNIENIEDADYYTEEQAAMIRTITGNGYWGVVGTEIDENGNEVPKEGSLEAMKQMLLASGEFTEEELALMNDGVALAATQMAIWTFSNAMSGVEFLNALKTNDPDANGELKTSWASGLLKSGELGEVDRKTVDLLYKIYGFMITMEPTAIEKPTTNDTIINADNFLENMSVTVIEKAKDHENNKDDDRDNDAYVTNLTFALVVEPSTENGDDLVVKVIGADGTPIAAGRIAGTLTEQDIVDGVKELSPDENGNYSFTGITMIEGEQNFNLTLEGIQNLKEGVYLYSSEVRSEDGDEVSSQTLVGKAGGKHAVSVEMNITFELDVKETVVARERVWRTETTHEDPPPPAEYRLGFGVGQLEVIEEEVPLAAPPQTGDMSILWFAMIALSGCGLCILNLLEKRKCRA